MALTYAAGLLPQLKCTIVTPYRVLSLLLAHLRTVVLVWQSVDFYNAARTSMVVTLLCFLHLAWSAPTAELLMYPQCTYVLHLLLLSSPA